MGFFTASKMKETNSNLIQLVSGSNRYGGFATVDITEGQIRVKHYRLRKSRHQQTFLRLLLDDNVVLIHIDFEEIPPLGTRQVLRLFNDTC